MEIIIYEKKIKAFYNQIKGKVNIAQKLEKRPWGQLDFRVEDPFGYYIRVGEPQNLIGEKKGKEKKGQKAKED